MANTSSYLADVRHIVLEGLRGYQARVYLFGSRARGEARSTSAEPAFKERVEREGIPWHD